MTDDNTKVLLVDDDVELNQLIADYLSSNGYQVSALHSGDEIEQKIATFHPDIIILDLMLPGIDGLTICRNIRASFTGAIIMLTALGDDIDEVTGLEVGADDYLAKLVKPRVLLAHIRAQMRRFTQVKNVNHEAEIFCNEEPIS